MYIRDSDSVVFFNFRPDRAREITRAITDPAFAGFERKKWPSVHFVCPVSYTHLDVYKRQAVVCDSRNGDFFGDLEAELSSMREAGVSYKTLFLDAARCV